MEVNYDKFLWILLPSTELLSRPPGHKTNSRNRNKLLYQQILSDISYLSNFFLAMEKILKFKSVSSSLVQGFHLWNSSSRHCDQGSGRRRGMERWFFFGTIQVKGGWEGEALQAPLDSLAWSCFFLSVRKECGSTLASPLPHATASLPIISSPRRQAPNSSIFLKFTRTNLKWPGYIIFFYPKETSTIGPSRVSVCPLESSVLLFFSCFFCGIYVGNPPTITAISRFITALACGGKEWN